MSKTLKIFIFFGIAILIILCDTSDDLPADINFQAINKTINVSNSDSITGTCKDLIFEIIRLDANNYTAIINLNSNVIHCDGFNNIRANLITGAVEPLDMNQTISENDNWKSARRISLDEFAGKGEKYIGYRSGFYPLSTKEYYYGWIKIELSENKETLKIISRATNNIKNESISSGQK